VFPMVSHNERKNTPHGDDERHDSEEEEGGDGDLEIEGGKRRIDHSTIIISRWEHKRKQQPKLLFLAHPAD